MENHNLPSETPSVEIEILRQRVTELENWIEQHRQAENTLSLRLDQLTCLYNLSQVVGRPETEEDQNLQFAVELIPSAWGDVETCARIVLGTKEFKTPNFRETPWKQTASIVIPNQPPGKLEVFYLEEIPAWHTDPPLNPVVVMAKKLGQYLERKELEEVMRSREEQLRITLNSIGDAVIATDLHGRVTQMNPVAETLTGWPMAEAAGQPLKTVFNIVNAQTGIEAENPVARVLATGVIVGLANHTMLISKNGREYQIADSAAPIKDENGRVTGVVMVFRDVTEEYRMREELEASENKFSILFSRASLPAVLSQFPSHEFVDVNDAWTEIFGYTREELIGKTSAQVGLSRTPAKRTDIINTIQQKGQIRNLEQTLYSKSGEPLTVLTNVNVITINGQAYALTSLQDITERKKAEEALRKSEDLFSKAFLSSPVPMTIARQTDGIWIEANDSFLSLIEYGREEVIGHTSADLNLIDAEERAALRHRIAQKGSLHNIEVQATTRSGRTLHLLNSWENVELAGEPCTVSIMVDITEKKQAEEKFQRMVEGAPDPIFVQTEKNFAYLNPAACQLFGLQAPGELIGTPVIERIHPDYRTKVAGRIRQLNVAQKPVNELFEQRFLRLDGSEVWVETKGEPIVYEGKQGALVFVRDITERKLAAAQIEYQAHLLQNVADAIISTDQNFVIRSWNKAAEAIYGWKEEEVIGKPVGDVLDTEYADASAEAVQQLHTHGFWKGDVIQKHKNGTRLNILSAVTLVRNSTGNPVDVVAVNRDITARTRAEQAQKRLTVRVGEQAQQMEQILATVPAGVLLVNAEGQILQANPEAEGSLTLLAGVTVGDVLVGLGDRALAELLTSPPTRGLWHEVKANGRVFEVIARPVESGSQSEQWVLVINDVTRERQIQVQLQQQAQLAAVGQLAAGIAHDFNNIMAVIVLYSQMGLNSPDSTQTLNKYWEIVSQQAEQASDLIKQILDFSRRSVLERQILDLTAFLQKVVELLERTVPEHIALGLNYGPEYYTVFADPTRLQQIVMNLAINARDAMPAGGNLRLDLQHVTVLPNDAPPLPEMTPGKWVRLTITDTGTGIPPEVLPHIFEPFFTTKGVGKGTGLGLAQVYGIVKQHEGHIDVTTTAGMGTTFTIYLPALHSPSPETQALELPASVRGQGEVVLVVEDNPALREALSDTLQLLNYRVIVAANGREALTILEEQANEIALVLSDLVMPEMGGQTLFRIMKQRGLNLPVVMLSGHPLEKELVDMQAQGLAGWMIKPPNQEQFAQLLARLLQGKPR